jgi:hypothetical protein
VGAEPFSVAVADFNGDGKPDLAAANMNSGSVSVLLNTTATGSTSVSFAPERTFAVDGHPWFLAVGDFDGDGKPDLVTANFYVPTVSVLLNTTPTGATTPSFASQRTFVTGTEPRSVGVADFNGDGKPDLVAANTGSTAVAALLNTTRGLSINGSPATGTISSALQAPATITVVAGNNQTTTVNTAFPTNLAVDVRDAGGYLVQNASVRFTAPPSGPSGTFGSNNSVVVVTNASGRATAPTLIANTISGNFAVTAQASGGSDPSPSLRLSNTPGAPATLAATAGSNQSTTVNTAFATNLLATLMDEYGNRVPGVTITFTPPNNGASASFPTGNTGVTDANGQVSKGIKANTVAGTYNITAAATGGSNPTTTFVNLTNVAGPPAILTATGGSNQSATVNTAFGTALTATLTDEYGNRLAGVLVTFMAPNNGASSSFGGGNTATTDGNGQVSKSITANTVAGTYNITATASGGD